MARDTSYQAVMARQNEIMKKSLGMDYEQYVRGPIAFAYEAMMSGAGYTLEKIRRIQRKSEWATRRFLAPEYHRTGATKRKTGYSPHPCEGRSL